MNKLWSVLKCTAVLICIVLMISFLFGDVIIDIIDLIVPGDFPEWVYIAETVAWAAIGLFALLTWIKRGCKQRKANEFHAD